MLCCTTKNKSVTSTPCPLSTRLPKITQTTTPGRQKSASRAAMHVLCQASRQPVNFVMSHEHYMTAGHLRNAHTTQHWLLHAVKAFSSGRNAAAAVTITIKMQEVQNRAVWPMAPGDPEPACKLAHQVSWWTPKLLVQFNEQVFAAKRNSCGCITLHKWISGTYLTVSSCFEHSPIPQAK